jgi:hypothetical protein
MAIRERTRWILLLLIICTTVLVSGIGFLVSRAKLEVRNAKEFCESLIPRLESEKARNGRYPEHLESDWWRGRKLPKLLNGRKFYWALSEGQGYSFTVDNPPSFWTDRLSYNSRSRRWIAYETHRK